MARGRKKQETFTLEEQLENVTKEITECENHLKELKDRRKAIRDQIEEAQKEKLYRAVKQSGRSIDEVIAAICDKKEENE